MTVTVATTATETAIGGGAEAQLELPVKATSKARGGIKTTIVKPKVTLPSRGPRFLR